ncbi:MAG TPA: alpha/beta hydrolase [Nitrolancea sp.]|nr:alpha/beta hydrolase [Nitrolancea sp.]
MRRLALIVVLSLAVLAVSYAGFGRSFNVAQLNPSKSVAAAATPGSGEGRPGISVASPGAEHVPSSLYSVTHTSIMTVYHNIEYGSAGGHELLLDAYVPNGGPHPAVLVIHGGGWAYGDKHFLAFEGENLAAAGFGAFVVNYRLAPPGGTAHAPIALEDVRTAVNWVRTNAARYDINSHEIGALGNSAGGNLAMMLGTTGTPGLDRVNAVVSYSGQSELLTLSTKHTIHAATNYLGCAATVCRDAWIANSPIDHVDQQTAPMLLVNSTHELMPLDQATTMAAKLQQVGIAHGLKVLNGDTHASAYANEVWPETLAFLRQYLGS